MKKHRGFPLFAAVALLLAGGCTLFQEEKKLPSEDIEIFKFYPELISVLKNPNLPSNSREKYDAAREINDIFFYGDAIIDSPDAEDRTISFNYQYGDHYVRFRFFMFRNFVLRVEVTEK